MSCQITGNITTPCNRNQGGIRKIYIANGPLAVALDSNGIITFLSSTPPPTYTPITPWYTIELPRVTGTFDEVFEINQANGTVVYNQELRFVTNTHDTTTRARLIELAQSNDMIVIFEDNNGKQWLMGESHGCYLSTATTETGVNYSDRNGHTIVIAARNPEPAQEVWNGANGGPSGGDPVDPNTLGSYGSYLFASSSLMTPPIVYPQWTNRITGTGWQTYYDTVTAVRQNSYWAGYLGIGGIAFVGTNVAQVGAIAYIGFPSNPYYGYRSYINGRGYVYRTSVSAPSSTWKIVDFDQGVVTAVKNFSDYTCTKPDPLEGSGYDPYYKIYYGYEYLGNTTTWVSDVFGYDLADAKAVIEAMPAGATPLYYRVIKTRGHVPIQNPGPVINKPGNYWPFPMSSHFPWNYDTNSRADIPRGEGYLFNNNNKWDLGADQINMMFGISQASSTPGIGIFCPEASGASDTSLGTLYEDV